MVSEQGKCLTALKAAGSSLSKVSGAHPRQCLGVERQRLPAPSGQLLKPAPYVCVGGVRCQGEHSVRGGLRQRYRSHHGRLEGGGGWPLQRLGVPSECIGEGLERAGDTWKETSVKIHHT